MDDTIVLGSQLLDGELIKVSSEETLSELHSFAEKHGVGLTVVKTLEMRSGPHYLIPEWVYLVRAYKPQTK